MLLRALLIFVFGFVWSGTLNVLPQAYLLAHHPADKSLTLSLLMALGMSAAILGNRLSHRALQRGHRLQPGGLLLGAALSGVFMVGMIHEVQALWLYALAYFGLRVVSNALYNHLDVAMAAAAGAQRARQYASAVVSHQLLGQTLGPIAFAVTAGLPLLASLGTILLLAAGAAAALPALAATPPAPTPADAAAPAVGPSSRSTLPFALHVIFFQAATMGFLAEFIFLLRDFLEIEAPERLGGTLITGMGVVAVATALLQARRGVSARRTAFLWPGGLMLLGLVSFVLRVEHISLPLSVVLAGVGYGQFLVASRMHATLWPVAAERPAVLSLYNFLPNIAALSVYAIIATLAATVGDDPARLDPILLSTFAVLYAASGLAVLAFPPDP